MYQYTYLCEALHHTVVARVEHIHIGRGGVEQEVGEQHLEDDVRVRGLLPRGAEKAARGLIIITLLMR